MGWRFILGLPLAAITAFLIFLGMSKLIEPGDIEIVEPEERPVIELGFEREPVDPPPPPDPIIIDPPEPPEISPPEGIDPPTITEGGPRPPTKEGPAIEIPSYDREPQPLVRTEPQNWENCLSNRTGEDHSVRLVFDVTPTGETSSVEVVDSTLACLDRSAIRAAERWRYAPKISEGEAVWQYGVTTTILYRLEE